MSQSVMILFISIGLLLTFLFVIIPAFFNFVTNVLNSGSPFQETDEIPPQIPIISAPVSATSSAQLKLSGFGEPESEVIVVLNGSKLDEVIVSEEGEFSLELSLEDGENTIAAYSRDAAENESSLSREYTTVFDNSPPKLEDISPEDGSLIETRENQSIQITGLTDEESGVRIYINERLVFPKPDGTFSYTYRLEEGENPIKIVARDQAGNENTAEVTYTFEF